MKALPHRGLEVGGLLLGVSADGPSIDGLWQAEVEHRFGPSFRLSGKDLDLFREAAADATNGVAVGHFRSCTSAVAEVVPDDDAIADLLGVPEPLLVLIPASPDSVEDAALYRRVEGRWTVVVHSFPLRPSARETAAAPVLELARGPADRGRLRAELLNALPTLEPPPPAPAKRNRRMPAWVKWLPGAAVVLILAAAGGWYVLAHRPASPPARVASSEAPPPAQSPAAAQNDSEIGLTVRPHAEGMLVEWNPSSRPVRQAVSGILTIGNGRAQRRMLLTPEQLRAGNYAYLPETAAVMFRLEVYQDQDRYTGETVRVQTPAAPRPRRIEHAVIPQVQDAPKAAGPVQKSELRRFEPPRQASRQRQQVAPMPPAPAAANGGVKLTPSPVRDTPSAPLPAPAAQAPPVRPPAPEITQPVQSAPAPAISYVSAVPIRRFEPAVPANVRPFIRGTVTLEVRVTVDEAGKVSKAVAVESGVAAAHLLAPQAIQAARQWRFQPARRNGQPEASELILTFNFHQGDR